MSSPSPPLPARYDTDGSRTALFTARRGEDGSATCTLHVMPHAPVRPVFLTDKQREGVVKAFPDMTKEELAEYHELHVRVGKAVCAAEGIRLVLANHCEFAGRSIDPSLGSCGGNWRSSRPCFGRAEPAAAGRSRVVHRA